MNKTIRRVLSLVAIVAVIMVMACACGGSKYTGKWKIDSITASGVTISNENYKALAGEDIGTIEIKDNGNVVLSIAGQNDINAKFKESGDKAVIKDSVSTYNCKIENGKLVVEGEDGVGFTCTK